MPTRSWRSNLSSLLDCRSSLNWLGSLAWYCGGVVFSALTFYLSAQLTWQGGVPVLGGIALCLSVACASGVCLGWRATRSRLWRLSAVVALYLPLLYGVLWVAALCQDLWRGEGFPGRSLDVMTRLSGHYSIMIAMLCMAVAMLVGGLLAGAAVKMLRSHRSASTSSTTGAAK